jgi:hypothetical protein
MRSSTGEFAGEGIFPYHSIWSVICSPPPSRRRAWPAVYTLLKVRSILHWLHCSAFIAPDLSAFTALMPTLL